MTVAFFSSEVFPFAKTGGMADVCGALPLALEELGIPVIIVMPKYKTFKADGMTVRKLPNGVVTTRMGKNISVYFIEGTRYFDREGLYGDEKGDYVDNLERFAFYCLRALQLLKEENLAVDIVHCHDWPSSLAVAYLKCFYKNDPFFKKTKSVLTIHNLAYQGIFPKKEFSKLKLDEKSFSPEAFEFYDQINLLKGGITLSDAVSTVSPTYAHEIQTPALGCGLDGVLKKRGDRIWGILNGLERKFWDPQNDSFLIQRYSRTDFHSKLANKRHLQEELGLPKRDHPLLGFVGRLSHQKGLDLVSEAIAEIAKRNLQMVFLGIGEKKYQELLRQMARRYPQKIAVHLSFDEPLAHRIYAGSDIFLMPSRYEPCGLSQMIALYYGTIPLVHKTGGLADTIFPFDALKGRGNGFVFEEYTPEALVEAIQEAVDAFHNREVFERLVQKAFSHDFSWGKSAGDYQRLYESLR